MGHNLLILAAGYATRMGALTRQRAKPLLEVAGRPMMDWVMDRFQSIPGLARTVVVSNSKFIDEFRRWGDQFDGSGDPVVIENGSTCMENKRGAIGDLQFSIEEQDLWDRDLIVVGGDNLFEISPHAFVEFGCDKPAVIGTYDVGSPEEVKRFASIETNGVGLISEFEEKPTDPQGTVAGIALYSFQREILPLIGQYLDEGNNPDQAGHLIAWLRHRVATYGFPVVGQWFDVGNAGSLAEADRVFGELSMLDSGCVGEGSRT